VQYVISRRTKSVKCSQMPFICLTAMSGGNLTKLLLTKDRGDVIEHGSQQGMARVLVATLVVIIKFTEELD